MHVHSKFLLPAVIAVIGLTLTGCAPTSSEASGPSTNGAGLPAVDVSIITSQTGPLAAYGATYLAGWNAGLDYATQGTGTVDGRAINVTIADDAGDVDKAVTAAKTVIGQGTQIIVGTASSGIALALAEQAEQNKILYISGPAAADGVTGINTHTFRSGRQSYQDVATAGTFIGDPKGKSILVFAQNTAFGQGNVAAATAVLGAKGATVTSLLVPEDATEFTPFAQQIINAAPDMVFVAWAGYAIRCSGPGDVQNLVFLVIPVLGVVGIGSFMYWITGFVNLSTNDQKTPTRIQLHNPHPKGVQLMRRVAGWVALGAVVTAITIAVVVFAYFWFVGGEQGLYIDATGKDLPPDQLAEVLFWFGFIAIPVLGIVSIASFVYWITGLGNRALPTTT